MDGQPVPTALLSDIRREYGRAVEALTAAARHHTQKELEPLEQGHPGCRRRRRHP
jgi:hypothetical protein